MTNQGDLVGAFAAVILMGTIFAIALGRTGRSWNPRRGNMPVRSASSPAMDTMLTTVGIAALVLQLAQTKLAAQIPGGPVVILIVAVALIIGTVLAGSWTKALLAVIGVALTVATLGLPGTIELTIMCALCLWLLGSVRGFTRR